MLTPEQIEHIRALRDELLARLDVPKGKIGAIGIPKVAVEYLGKMSAGITLLLRDRDELLAEREAHLAEIGRHRRNVLADILDEAEQAWRPATEKPEKTNHYIVAVRSYGFTEEAMYYHPVDRAEFGIEGWRCIDDESPYDEGEVLFWMPLPAFPVDLLPGDQKEVEG